MTRLLGTCSLFALALVTVASAAPASDNNWEPVAQALGKSGTEMAGGVYRVGMPRTDLKVSLDGVPLKPAFALGSWVAFKRMGNEAMVMGDLVLTETEIEPVMKKLQDSGLEITALHNHLLRAEPATFYMHVQGHGDPMQLARSVHDGLALSKTPLGNTPSAPPPDPNLDTAALDRILGAHGTNAGGVYQFGIPRADTVTAHGMAVPPAMGSAESINFQSTGQSRAAITGDFVLTAAEVTPVMRTLRDNGIDVTALHNHMLDDEPRMFFMHFWADDDAMKLATGLRAALGKINVVKQQAAGK
jgi:biotin operon repressor